jgi:thiol-disulfide isomerase/thioredoxin
MVQQEQSVVTPERYAQGKTYAEYVVGLERYRARFDENYAATAISAENAAALKALMAKPGGPSKIMVIGEDWCPDVFRGAPVFQRIAEATGMEIRFFERDQNKDIMGEFLKDGEHESIPVAVFYNDAMEELGRFTERPQLAYEEMRTLLRPMYEAMRRPDKTPEEQEAAKQANIAFQNGPVWANWRQETIREVIATLKAKLG